MMPRPSFPTPANDDPAEQSSPIPQRHICRSALADRALCRDASTEQDALLSRRMTFEGRTSPDDWLDLAQTWREEGRFRDALRAHRWYHAHALEADGAH